MFFKGSQSRDRPVRELLRSRGHREWGSRYGFLALTEQGPSAHFLHACPCQRSWKSFILDLKDIPGGLGAILTPFWNLL